MQRLHLVAPSAAEYSNKPPLHSRLSLPRNHPAFEHLLVSLLLQQFLQCSWRCLRRTAAIHHVSNGPRPGEIVVRLTRESKVALFSNINCVLWTLVQLSLCPLQALLLRRRLPPRTVAGASGTQTDSKTAQTQGGSGSGSQSTSNRLKHKIPLVKHVGVFLTLVTQQTQ